MRGEMCAVALLVLLYLHKACCHADNYDYIQTLHDRVEEMEEDMADGLDRVEDAVFQVQEDVKLIRTETERKLKRQIRNVKSEWNHRLRGEVVPLILPELVSKAVKEHLQNEKTANSISGAYAKEVQHLRQRMRILKLEISDLRKGFGNVERENNVLKEELQKMQRQFDIHPNLSQPPNKTLKDDPPSVTVTAQATSITHVTMETTQESSADTTSLPVSPPAISPATDRVDRRLLVVPFASSYDQQLQTLKIGYHWSETYDAYPVNIRHVLSVAYVSSRRTLLLSTYDPDMILSFPLDNNQTSVLKYDVASSGVAIDEGRELVIHTDWRRKSVNIMTSTGRDYIPLLNLPNDGGPVNSIALDEENMLIYVCDNHKLYSLTYIGLNVRIIIRSSYLSALAFHPGNNVLYFSEGTNVMTYFPSNETVVMINRLSVTPRSFQLLRTYGERLFLSGVDGGVVDVIYLGGNFRYHLPRPGMGGYMICFIH